MNTYWLCGKNDEVEAVQWTAVQTDDNAATDDQREGATTRLVRRVSEGSTL